MRRTTRREPPEPDGEVSPPQPGIAASQPAVPPRPNPLVHLLPMRRRHLRKLLEIERVSFPRPWSRGLYLSELAMRGTRSYLVALVDGDIVGYGGVMMVGGTGHITTIAVARAWQRRQIGTRVLVQLTEEIVMRGGTEAALEVRESNVAARALYTRFGYTCHGRRTNYYTETGEDAIIMMVRGIDGDAYQERVREIVAAIPGETRARRVPPW